MSAAAPSPPTRDRARDVTVASLPRRAAAAVLDAVPLAALWLGLGLPLVAAGGPGPDTRYNLLDRVVDLVNQRPSAVLASALVLAGLVVAWHALFEVALGASPGKRLVGLRVVDRHGAPPRAVRAVWHGLCRALGLATLGGAWLWAFVDAERRAVHDRLAGLWVVRGSE